MSFFDEFLLLLKEKGLFFGTKIFFLNVSFTVPPVAKVISKFSSTDFPFKGTARENEMCFC